MNKIQQQIEASLKGTATADDGGGFRGTYRFAQSFSGFDGHFPGNPILPAIVQIMTVVSLVKAHTGSSQHLVAVEDAKFLNPVRPDQDLLVQCRPRTIKEKPFFEAQLSVAGTPSANVLVELSPVEVMP